MQTSAKLITVEGIEGVGKSTCITFIKNFLEEHNIQFHSTREPGGTPIAEQIREILLSHHDELLHPETELMLMFASRKQHIEEIILPQLNQGVWVVSDRFVDASFAYQGGGRNIALDILVFFEKWVLSKLKIDLTFLLDAPADLALERAKRRSGPDRIEQEEIQFFERARSAYLERAKLYPERFRIINAMQPLEDVQAELIKHLSAFLSLYA